MARVIPVHIEHQLNRVQDEPVNVTGFGGEDFGFVVLICHLVDTVLSTAYLTGLSELGVWSCFLTLMSVVSQMYT
jgi:hypothetical protein